MLCFGTVLSGLPCNRKSRMSPWQLSPIEHSRFCFLFRYYGDFSSPLHPLVGAIVTWIFVGRQGKCDKIVTLKFVLFSNKSIYLLNHQYPLKKSFSTILIIPPITVINRTLCYFYSLLNVIHMNIS